jgi:hypothetical protein
MSYRCGKCNGIVGPGLTQLKLIKYRTVRNDRREISKEIPVCEACFIRGGGVPKGLIPMFEPLLKKLEGNQQ